MNNWRCNNCRVVFVGLPVIGVKVSNEKLNFELDNMVKLGGERAQHTKS